MTMKKIAILWAAAVAVLTLASCQKEQAIETSPEGFKVNICVDDLVRDAATKAIKTSWNAGDKLYIWLDENVQQTPDIVIKYNGSYWAEDPEATVSGKTPAYANGEMMVAYLSNDNMDDYIYSDLSEWLGGPCMSLSPPAYKYRINEHLPYKTQLSAVSECRYSFSEDVVSASITTWQFVNNFQVVISGLSGDWALCCDKFYAARLNLQHTRIPHGWNRSRGIQGDPVWGRDNEDGLVFYFESDEDFIGTDFNFTLINLDSKSESFYTASGKDASGDRSKLQAIIIPASKFKKALPAGALPGAFTVNSSGKKVHFSKGNLYHATEGWAFEDNQYDYRTWVGKNSCIKGVISDDGTPSGHIGLFFANANALNAIEQTFVNDCNNDTDILFANSEEVLGKEWKVLSADELSYLLSDRVDAAKKIGSATVAGVHGAIILPDEFTDPMKNKGNQTFVPKVGGSWNINEYSSGGDWEAMEAAGAVFFPASGFRDVSNVYWTNDEGYYRTSEITGKGDSNAVLRVTMNQVNRSHYHLNLAYSVRMVMAEE